MPKNTLEVQLSETCQLTGAEWAVWLERDKEWGLRASYRLDVRRRLALLAYLNLTPVSGWLNGSLTGNRIRSRKLPPQTGLAAEKLFVFPDQVTQRVILVGASALTTAAQRFWRVVALGGYSQPLLDLTPASGLTDVGLGAGFHLPDALDRMLDSLLTTVGSPAGWMAIRSGDFLEIKACAGCANNQTARISIESNSLLREIVQEKRGRVVAKGEPAWALAPHNPGRPDVHYWLGQPLVIGRRMIGLLGLWFTKSISRQELERIKKLVSQMTPSVEGSVIFSDLSSHLRRMALLNDFFVTISSAVNVESIVHRTFALLQRAFETERVVLLIISPGGVDVHEYYLDHSSTIVCRDTSGEHPFFLLLSKKETFRSDSLDANTPYKSFYPESRSAILVPLKYQQQLIGAVGLESARESNFTVYDEHLLAVIASHLASLLENSRLRQEAEARARNLGLIHDVVERTIGLTDVNQVAQIAAELTAKNFAYELAGIALVDPDGSFKLAGIGGAAAALVKEALSRQGRAIRQGIVGRVVSTGQSMLVNNVNEDPFYISLPTWEAGSEMCVALKDGEVILGAIDVESRKTNAFTQNDLLLLESLAGILGGVIASAGQYQNLQATVNQLQAARMELQERIAAQKMAESRLVQAAKLAAVGEMAAGIAHELNNPLTTVAGFTELALEEISADHPIRADLELVLRETKRARSVVRRLLDFARQSESIRTRSDLNEIVEDALALTHHLLRTGGVVVQTEFARNLPWVSVDRNQVKQVILNLIHNALHAMPAGGNLHISTSRQSRDKRNWATIVIHDTGVGIAPENIDRLFEPFFTTRSKEGGTGLGLSVSYGIIVDHGGDIDVKSKVGEGSTFTIWLPIEGA
jgi:signal transduction histidine kinase